MRKLLIACLCFLGLCGVAEAGPQVVVDANGIFVGILAQSGMVAFPVTGGWVGVTFDALGYTNVISGSPNLLYTTSNCTGTAYISESGSPVNGMISQSGSTIRLDYPVSPFGTQNIDSAQQANGSCSTFGSATPFVVGVDANQTLSFTTPFSLQ